MSKEFDEFIRPIGANILIEKIQSKEFDEPLYLFDGKKLNKNALFNVYGYRLKEV